MNLLAPMSLIRWIYLDLPKRCRPRAGQEGLEPPTRGFGVRCSTIRATALDLFGFLVVRMFSTSRAKLRQLELLGIRPLVFRRGVVALPTNRALQSDDD